MAPTKASLVVGIACGLVAMIAAQAQDATRKDPKAKEGPVARIEPKTTDAPKPRTKVDPKADAILRKMSTDLGKLETFSFDTAHVTEFITTDDQKLQVLASSTVTVQRPNKLRSDRKGPLGNVTLYYDGTKLSIYGKRANLYATASAPDTLDKTIDFARDELDLDAPAADLLYSDVYGALMENVVAGAYIDDAFIDGRVCKHLAFRGSETDWEVWVEDGARALPCRFVITTKDVKGWPQYTVEMSNWNPAPVVSEKTFTFVPPRGAGRIEFLSMAEAQSKQAQPKQAQPKQAQPTQGGAK